jgi:DNA polymerase-3 subunit epsilon
VRTRWGGVGRGRGRGIAALDLETTGTDPLSDQCVEIALVRLDETGRVTERHRRLVDADCDIPAEATAVHGISVEQVRAEGVAVADAIEELCELLAKVDVDELSLVIFNARFDWALLRAECGRLGMVLPDLALYDPMVVDRRFDKYRKGKRTQDLVAAHYGVAQGKAHAAEDDAICAGRIAQAVNARYPEVAGCDRWELHRLQTTWFGEWRDDFNGWLRRQGSADLVSGDWPW